MRKISKFFLGVFAIALVLAIPIQAKPRDGGPWLEHSIDPIVKSVKKLIFRTLGDGLSDPWP